MNTPPYHTLSEQQLRHRFVDDKIAEINTIITDNEAVRAALGPDIVADFIEVRDNYYVPNKRDNTFAPTPTQIASDAHAVVAVHADEMFRMSPDFARFSGTQVDNLLATVEPYNITGYETERLLDAWQGMLRDEVHGTRDTDSLSGMQALMGVYAVHTEIDADDDSAGFSLLRARPVYVLDRDTGIPVDVFFHEHVHHWLTQTRPKIEIEPGTFGYERAHLLEEDRAYVVEGDTLTALGIPRADMNSNQLLVFEAPQLIRSALDTPQDDARNPRDVFEESMVAAYERIAAERRARQQ